MFPINEQLGKALIVSGVVLAVIGAVFLFGKSIPLGKLPGDIFIKKENFSFYLPLTTCIIVSLILSVILRVFRHK